MEHSPTRQSPARQTLSWRHRLTNWLAALAELTLGPTDAPSQRQEVIRRPLVAAVILAVIPIQQLRIPGWPAVVAACAVAIVYNLPLAYLVYVKERYFLARTLGILLDSILLAGASFYVFSELGAAGSSSDIWLVFLVYIITGGFTLAPMGSLVYTALWVGWFALTTLLFFAPEGHYRDELWLRLVFLSMFGLISLMLAGELQKRREKVQQQNRQTMEMLATLVEARDTDAGAHLHRIQHFSRALALHIGLSQQRAQEIAEASLMHDVGKANVPDAVLKKTLPLTPEEWRIMQDHTVLGDRLLSENQDFEQARLVARWHHEHWDGRGYPDGLSGEEIPLAARIVAVADVYDALISKRTYKDAWPEEKAIAELRRMAGSHLDPTLVDSFVLLWEWGVIGRIAAEIQSEQGAAQTTVESAEAA